MLAAEPKPFMTKELRSARYDILKDQFCFKHIRERCGQARSLTGCLSKGLIAETASFGNRIYFLFTMSDNLRDAPERFAILYGRAGINLLCSGWLKIRKPHYGGARRDRTDDLMLAKHALSQLSYGPNRGS